MDDVNIFAQKTEQKEQKQTLEQQPLVQQTRLQDQVPVLTQQTQSSQMTEESWKQNADIQLQRVMPPVNKTVVSSEQKTQQLGRSISRAQATERLEQNGKFFGDSRLMARIKKQMNALNDALLLPMPMEENDFERELELRRAAYEQLTASCDTYIGERTGTRREPGMTRLRLIQEIREFLIQEKTNFSQYAQTVRSVCIENHQTQMPFWTAVLDNARAIKLPERPAGDAFKDKTDPALSEEDKTKLDRRTAYTRLAALMNLSTLTERVEKAAVSEDGKEKNGYLIQQEPDLISLKQLLENQTTQNGSRPADQPPIEIYYSPRAIYELSSIRDMDHMLGVTRTSEQYALKYEYREVTQGNRKHIVWRVNSVKAIGNDTLLTPERLDRNLDPKYAMNREFVTRLLALPAEAVRGALSDLLQPEQVEQVLASVSRMKKDVMTAKIECLQYENYYDHSKLERLKDQIVESDENHVFEAMNATIRKLEDMNQPLGKPQIPIRQPLDGQDELQKLFASDTQGGISTEWQKVRDALNIFLGMDLNQTGDYEYANATRDVLRAVRAWDEAQVADQTESRMRQSYKDKLEHIYGKVILNKRTQKEELKWNTIKDNLSKLDNYSLRAAQYFKQKKFPNNTSVLRLRDRSEEPLFTHQPCVSDIKQGYIGDCYLLSALTALVTHSPQKIMNMMKDEGDTVLVTFARNRSARVSKRVIARYNEKSGEWIDDWYARDTLWVQIMEKAYHAAGFRDNEKMSGTEKERKDFFYHMTRHTYNEFMDSPNGIDEVYADTMEALAGGEAYDALNDMVGFTFQVQGNRIYTVDDTGKAYKALWNTHVSAKNQPDWTATDEEKEYWPKIRQTLERRLRDPLLKELKYRQQTVYQMKDDTRKMAAYRSLTVEDVQETLMDLGGWKHSDQSVSLYDALLRELREEFPQLGIRKEQLDSYLKYLGEEMASVSQEADDSLEHRRQLHDTDQGRYSKKAKNVYQQIEDACRNNRIVLAGTRHFEPMNAVEKGGGLNGESMRDGMAQGHAYTVLGCRERQDQQGHTQYFIQMHNPWGDGVVAYRTQDLDNGKRRLVAATNKDKSTNGIFELELNDFMQFVSMYQISQ